MAFLNARNPQEQRDRRVTRRYVIDCAARLTMARGDRAGRLVDLSELGARLETEYPPPPGTTGFLRWGGEDHYCRVMWASDGRCGLQFDRPIAMAVVEATCSRVEVEMRPIAAVGRIPLGQRRGGPVAIAVVKADAD